LGRSYEFSVYIRGITNTLWIGIAMPRRLPSFIDLSFLMYSLNGEYIDIVLVSNESSKVTALDTCPTTDTPPPRAFY